MLLLLLPAGIIFCFKSLGYELTYQETASMPIGWYLQTPINKVKKEDVVIVNLNQNWQQYLVRHHWIGKNMTLMKHVFAIPGDTVCIKHQHLLINGRKVVKIYKYYAKNKPLPQWHFCGRVPNNQYLLLSTLSLRSFDGRYFGLIQRSSIIGKGIKL